MKLSGISKTNTQWFDQSQPTWTGISIDTGWMSVGGIRWTAVKGTQITKTPPWSINYSNVSVVEAVSPDGNAVKVSISDAQGALNLTLIKNSDGSVFLKTTGWLNFQGFINGKDTSISNAISNLATQRHFAPQSLEKTEDIRAKTISNLFYAAGVFSGTTYAALIAPASIVASMAKKYNMSVNQMNAQFDAVLIGNLSFLVNIAINSGSGTAMAANDFFGFKGILENLKTLLPFAGATVTDSKFGNVIGQAAGAFPTPKQIIENIKNLIKFYNNKWKAESAEPKVQNVSQAMENLIKSQEFANFLNTAQGQEVLSKIEAVIMDAISDSITRMGEPDVVANGGKPDPQLVDEALINMSAFSNTEEFRNLINSSAMSQVIDAFNQNVITQKELEAVDFFAQIQPNNLSVKEFINTSNALISSAVLNIVQTGTIDGGLSSSAINSVVGAEDTNLWNLESLYNDTVDYYENGDFPPVSGDLPETWDNWEWEYYWE